MRDFHEQPDDWYEELASQFIAPVQDELRSCVTCEPWDEAKPVWVFGEATTLDEVFDQVGVYEETEVREALAAQVRCPRCGSNAFEISSKVGVRGRIERELQQRCDLARVRHQGEIESLQEFLARTPQLGLQHELGKALLEQLQDPTRFQRCEVDDRLFRARRSDGADPIPTEKMGAAPRTKAENGRFSSAGQTALYLASDAKTAAAEALGGKLDGAVYVQEFLVGPIEDVLDLTVDVWEPSDDQHLLLALLDTGALLEAGENPGSKWRPEHLLPRFVADCARHAKYRGIRYPSVRTGGTNVVLFDPESLGDKIQPVGPVRRFRPAEQPETSSQGSPASEV